MEDKLVKVLLSAYNGEKYIGQQIDSILNQTYSNIEIYVRDDGSKDGTLEVLKPYVEAGKIHLEAGENVGFVKSFFWLIENSGEADYYAFSDQDDIWFENKIEMAMEKLAAKERNDIPVLYFSNYDFYDGDMNFIAHNTNKNPDIHFRGSLVDCVSLGFNSVFNKKARDLTIENMPRKITGHDWWMYMLCTGMGEVIYDSRPTVKYRRHNSNVSDGGYSFWKFQVWRFKRFFIGGYFHKIHEQIKEFNEFFGDKLNEENRKIIDMFSLDGFHPMNTLKKIFFPKRYRQKVIDELFLRLIILMGRL